MSVLKIDYKDASQDRKEEMLGDIISRYRIEDKAQLIQALAHCQAIYGCTQEEFASHPEINITSRTLRSHKSEYAELYTEAFAKYTEAPQLQSVDAEIDSDALEAVYQNLMSRLRSPKTLTKDISLILEYFGVSKADFKQFADFRNTTLRAFLMDNLTRIIQDEADRDLIKSVIVESEFLYQGTASTAGATHKAMTMDIDDPMVRLELETLGLIFVSLFNGHAPTAFDTHAKTLRLLKWANGDPRAMREARGNHYQFDLMEGRLPERKSISLEDCISLWGAEEGREAYESFARTKRYVQEREPVQLPKYEEVSKDYETALKPIPKDDALNTLINMLMNDDKNIDLKYQKHQADMYQKLQK